MTIIYPDDFKGQRVYSQALINAARNLIPVLRERTQETEKNRCLPEETRQDLRRSGVARLLQPASFGGAEGSLEHLVDILIPVASGCPSTSWCLAQYLFHNYMIAHWPLEAQKEVWEDPTNLVSGILVPRLGKARQVEGGYELTGQWPFVSGVEPSDWCILSGMVEQDAAPDEERYFLVRKSALTILDTWDPIGLHGSGSHDVKVESLFVPEHLTLSIQSMKGGDFPAKSINRGAVYRPPLLMISGILPAACLIGMTEAMFENFLLQSRDRKSLRTSEDTVGFPTHQMRVGEVSASLQAAEMLLRADCREIMELAAADCTFSAIERSNYRSNSAYAGQLARRASEAVWDLIGARGAYATNMIASYYRDIAVASRHTAINWEVNATEHGRARLRLPLTNPSL
ncbi:MULTISPECIES: acyl-CoA dehydrogenase [unclassified Rhizobium]|uniref:acyl-CoA dehydrogenase n=1 Tax=unclassified Rhizobium TaxID=2613769 RepID=UPI000DE0D22D